MSTSPNYIQCSECDLPPRYDNVLCDVCIQAHEKVEEIEATPGMDARHRAMKAYVRGAIVQEKQLYRVRGMLEVHHRRAVYFNDF